MEIFSDDKNIFNSTQKNQLHPEQTNFQKPSKGDLGDSWFGRSAITLSKFAWPEVVKSIYHSAKEVLTEIPNAIVHKTQDLKAQFFNISSGFQESYKGIYALFKDRYEQFHKLSSDQPILFPEEQLKEIKLSKLSKRKINSLFPFCKDITFDRKRFANFSGVDVQAALNRDKLNSYQVQLISIEQINEFDFSTLSQKVINMFFPPYSVDHLRQKYSYWTVAFKSINGKVLENREESRCRYTEAELQKISQELKQKNEQLLKQLLPKQRQVVEPRLYQNDYFNGSFRDNSQPQFDPFIYFFNNFFQQEFGDNFFEKPIPFTNFLRKSLLLSPSLAKTRVIPLWDCSQTLRKKK